MDPCSDDDEYAHELFETPLPSARDPPASPGPEAVAPARHGAAVPPAEPASLDDDDAVAPARHGAAVAPSEPASLDDDDAVAPARHDAAVAPSEPASLDDDDELERRKRAIKGDTNLRRPPYPERPVFTAKMSVRARLVAVQQFINAFEYNHTGANYFTKRRDRGLKHVSLTAKDIIREALPIQCVEAVFLACYLTAEMKEIERFPLSFKSNMGGRMYRHIVLAVEHQGKWGALGISRRDTLMYKELKFSSLSALVLHFKDSYAGCCHELVKVYVGLPFAHDVFSSVPVKWRVLRASLQATNSEQVAAALDRYAKDGTWAREYHARTGELPEAFARKTGLQASEYTSDLRASAARKPAVKKMAKRSKRARRRKSVVKGSDGNASETKPAEAEAEAEAGSSDDEADRYSSSDEERDVEAEPEPAPARDSENGPIATPAAFLGV